MNKKIYAIILTLSFASIGLYGKSMRYNLVAGLPDIFIGSLSERIGHTWVNGKVYEKHLIEKFYRLLAAENNHITVFDIGAQSGCFSLLAKYLPNSTWYSFDPIEEATTALKENLILNNIQNVFVHQIALSDTPGKKILYMPAMNAWGLATLGENPLRFDPVMQREVKCICLDNFVTENNIKKIDFMKLDTEGSELYILRGAQKTIARDHPVILMEYNETNMKQCGVTKNDMHTFLSEMGYTWKLVSTEDILCTPYK